MKNLKKLLFCSFLLLWTCRPAEEKAAERPSSYPDYFLEVLQAHGDLEQWNKLGSVQFKLTGKGSTETHIIDLKNRKDLVKSSGKV